MSSDNDIIARTKCARKIAIRIVSLLSLRYDYFVINLMIV